ncbi:hypothetical protein NPIL_195071 [Nephila pilipes]|uniref:Uncharacterized protein n=1 Tax=Nephila pilipes TaxID=299642 RepID=A0A8X6UGV4_NEPPI|nr:hypothetical protein NPIL_195071 [Nephila pilipes]
MTGPYFAYGLEIEAGVSEETDLSPIVDKEVRKTSYLTMNYCPDETLHRTEIKINIILKEETPVSQRSPGENPVSIFCRKRKH